MRTAESPALFRRQLLLSLSLGAAFAACRKPPALPTFGIVPTFDFVNQDGKRVATSALRGCVWVAAFMFTRCPTICPRITKRMRGLQEQASLRKIPLRFVSFSVDPENDRPAELRDYARRFGADLRTWSFVTGDFAAMQRVSVDGFKLALEGRADAAAPDLGILHGSHLVLVDRELRIRGYYRTEDDTAMAALLADAAPLAG